MRKTWKNVIKAYKQAKRLLTITKVAKLYIILKTILYIGIKSLLIQVFYEILKWKLTSFEKKSIKRKVFNIQSWVTMSKIDQFWELMKYLLQVKNNYTRLAKNLILRFPSQDSIV